MTAATAQRVNRKSRYHAWHLSFVAFDLIQFQDDQRLSFACLRPVLRRWSASEQCWLYARRGERKIGAVTK